MAKLTTGFCTAAVFTACVMTAQAQELIPLEVSLGDVSLNKVAFLVAADNGIYEKNGLKVRQFITAKAANRIKRSGVSVPPEFVNDDEKDAAPISIGGGSPMIVSMTSDARTTERVILATFDDNARFHIISSKDLNSVDDLKGKRLGYSSFGSVSHLMALALLKQKGWSPETDISLVGEGMAYEALNKNKIDAFIGSEIYYGMAAKHGAKDLVDLSQFNIPIAGSGINADKEWLKNNRDTARRFVKASIDAYAFMKNNKQATLQAIEKWYNVKDRGQQEKMYQSVEGTPMKPYPAVNGIRQVLSLFTYREIKRSKPEDFYDASFVAELDKSGYIDSLYKKN
jgi:ABC-type nitrate/sulfonate/bicarbonate transport system substrate-binding protein